MSREMELLSFFNQAALLKCVLQFRVFIKIVCVERILLLKRYKTTDLVYSLDLSFFRFKNEKPYCGLYKPLVAELETVMSFVYQSSVLFTTLFINFC